MLHLNEVDQVFREHMDINDTDTLNCLLNEADQNQMLSSLTSKLYDKIVEKVDKIDFGTIPKSKGDITKIENFESLLETINLIRDIVKQYGQSTEPIDIVDTAIENIKSRENLFSKAYALDVELPIVLYNTITLSIVSSVSFLIATSIEYIKSPGDDTFQVSLDKTAYNKTAHNLLFTDLKRFNDSCKKGDINMIINNVMNQAVKKESIGAVITVSASIIFLATLAKNILPILQELVYFFFHSRQSISDYFAVQADLLQINASNLVYKTDIDESRKKDIIKKQNKIASKFRSISNFFDITYKKSEKESKKSIKDEAKKYKASDFEQDNGSTYTLF